MAVNVNWKEVYRPVRITGDGNRTNYSPSFPVLELGHLKVWRNGIEIPLDAVNTATDTRVLTATLPARGGIVTLNFTTAPSVNDIIYVTLENVPTNAAIRNLRGTAYNAAAIDEVNETAMCAIAVGDFHSLNGDGGNNDVNPYFYFQRFVFPNAPTLPSSAAIDPLNIVNGTVVVDEDSDYIINIIPKTNTEGPVLVSREFRTNFYGNLLFGITGQSGTVNVFSRVTHFLSEVIQGAPNIVSYREVAVPSVFNQVSTINLSAFDSAPVLTPSSQGAASVNLVIPISVDLIFQGSDLATGQSGLTGLNVVNVRISRGSVNFTQLADKRGPIGPQGPRGPSGTPGEIAGVQHDTTLAGSGTPSDQLRVSNPFTQNDELKLDSIATGATVGSTPAQAAEVASNTANIAANTTKLNGIEPGATDGANAAQVAQIAANTAKTGIPPGAQAGQILEGRLFNNPPTWKNKITAWNTNGGPGVDLFTGDIISRQTVGGVDERKHYIVNAAISQSTNWNDLLITNGTLRRIDRNDVILTNATDLNAANPFRLEEGDYDKTFRITATTTANLPTGVTPGNYIVRVYRYGTDLIQQLFDVDAIYVRGGRAAFTSDWVSFGDTAITTDNTMTGNGTIGSPLGVGNPFTAADETKLDGIATNATIDQTPAELVIALESLTGTNRLQASAIRDLPSGGGGLSTVISNDTLTGDGSAQTPLSVANPFTADDETKLDGIETAATADQTTAQIITGIQAQTGDNRIDASAIRNLPQPSDGGLSSVSTDTTLAGLGTTASQLRVANPFTEADETKLDGVEAGATGDQTAAEIVTALEALSNDDRLSASAIKDLPSGGGNTVNGVINALLLQNGTLQLGRQDGTNINIVLPRNQFTGVSLSGQVLQLTTAAGSTTSITLPSGGISTVNSDSSLTGTGANNSPLGLAQTVIDLIQANTNKRTYPSADQTKLGLIEANATADQTPTEIRNDLQSLTGSNRLDASAIQNLPQGGDGGLSSVASDGTLTGLGTNADVLRVATPFTTTEKSKLGGIADNATVGASASQATAINANTLKRTYPQGDQTKLSIIEPSATADQTGSEIVGRLQALTGNNRLPSTAIRDFPSGDSLNFASADPAWAANLNLFIKPTNGVAFYAIATGATSRDTSNNINTPVGFSNTYVLVRVDRLGADVGQFISASVNGVMKVYGRVGRNTYTTAWTDLSAGGSGTVADGSITTAKLANEAVTNAKLGPDAVDSTKIADSSIFPEHIQSGAITTPKIGDLSVTLNKLATNSVIASKIADGVVGESKLAIENAGSTGQVLSKGNVAFVWTDLEITDNSLYGIVLPAFPDEKVDKNYRLELVSDYTTQDLAPSAPVPGSAQATGNFTGVTDNNNAGGGLWVNDNGTVMYVSDNLNVYAHGTDNARISGLGFVAANIKGLWGDGTTLWGTRGIQTRVRAYTIATRTANSSEDINLPAGTVSYGIWGNANTIWVADDTFNVLLAFDKTGKSREVTRDIPLDSANTSARGIWSDGTTMWVLNNSGNTSKVFAYNISSKLRASELDIEASVLTGAGNTDPQGMTGRNYILYVWDGTDNRVYAYNSPTPDPANVNVGGGFARSYRWVEPSSGGGGGTVADGSITTAKLANLAVTNAKLADNSVSTAKLADLTVTNAKMADNSVSTAKIVDGAITRDKISGSGTAGQILSRTSTGLDWVDVALAGGNATSIRSTGIPALPAPTMTTATGTEEFRIELTRTHTQGATSGGADINGLDWDGTDFVYLNSGSPEHIFTDGTTMWVTGSTGDRVYAYNLSTMAPQLLNSIIGSDGRGIWGDGTTIWIARTSGTLEATTIATGARDTTKDISLGTGVDPEGIWSNGDIMWVVNGVNIFAYNMDDSTRNSARDISVNLTAPRGIWGDGTTLFVKTMGTRDVFAYNLSTGAADTSKNRSLAFVTDINSSFTMPNTSYTGAFTANDTHFWSGTSNSAGAIAFPVTLRSHTKTGVRFSAGDFRFGAGDNSNNNAFAPSDNFTNFEGIWTDGTTMYIASDNNNSIRSYNLSTHNRDTSKEISLHNNGNRDPRGIYSDGTTMWVADRIDDKLYAYTLSSRTANTSQDFNTLSDAGNTDPTGIWTDGTTMWVADGTADKIFAYNVSDKARNSSQDFNTLQAAGNTAPRGIWGDGTYLWVSDNSDNTIYAYNISTKARDSSRDKTTSNPPTYLTGNSNTAWSVEGTTIQAFFLPGSTIAESTNYSFNWVDGENTVPNNSITTDKIADNTITNAKMADDAIGAAELDTTNTGTSGQVLSRTGTGLQWVEPISGTGTTVADGSITEVKLASNAVTTAKISNDAVTGPKIAPNSVSADKITANNTPIAGQIAEYLGANVMTWVDKPVGTTIADGSITTAKLANNAVTNVKLANDAVTSNKIADGNVGVAELGTTNTGAQGQVLQHGGGSVIEWVTPSSGTPAAGSIGTTELADNAITTAKLNVGSDEGSTGEVLTRTATGMEWAASSGGGGGGAATRVEGFNGSIINTTTTTLATGNFDTTDYDLLEVFSSTDNNPQYFSKEIVMGSTTNRLLAGLIGIGKVLSFQRISATTFQVYEAEISSSAASNLTNTWRLTFIKFGGATGPVGPAGPAGTLTNGSVTTAILADDAVTGPKIAANAVGQSEIAANAVGTDQVLDGNITQAKLADNINQSSFQFVAAVSGSFTGFSNGTGTAFGTVENQLAGVASIFHGSATSSLTQVQNRIGVTFTSSTEAAKYNAIQIDGTTFPIEDSGITGGLVKRSVATITAGTFPAFVSGNRYFIRMRLALGSHLIGGRGIVVDGTSVIGEGTPEAPFRSVPVLGISNIKFATSVRATWNVGNKATAGNGEWDDVGSGNPPTLIASWNAGSPFNSTEAQYVGGSLGAIQTHNTSKTGTAPPTAPAGSLILRRADNSASITGNIEQFGSGTNIKQWRITSAAAMITAFGTVNITSGPDWILEQNNSISANNSFCYNGVASGLLPTDTSGTWEFQLIGNSGSNNNNMVKGTLTIDTNTNCFLVGTLAENRTAFGSGVDLDSGGGRWELRKVESNRLVISRFGGVPDETLVIGS